jgi:ATP adenylyltransferase
MSDSVCESNCLFCRWIRGERPMLTRLGTIAAFHDGFPVTDGHLLIVPLRHTPDWFSMTEKEHADSQALIRRLAEQIMRKDPAVTGFNIGTNSGASAGQTVFHAHIHLIPRRKGDCANPEGGVRGVIDGKRCYGKKNA